MTPTSTTSPSGWTAATATTVAATASACGSHASAPTTTSSAPCRSSPRRPSVDRRAHPGCAYHGVAFAHPGFRGRGWECRAYTDFGPAEWTVAKPWMGADGEVRWYCASRWEDTPDVFGPMAD